MQSGEASTILSSVIGHIEVEAGIGALHTNDTNEESIENQMALAVIPVVPLIVQNPLAHILEHDLNIWLEQASIWSRLDE